MHIHHQNHAKGTFRFYPSKKVDVIGSFGQETFIQRHEKIDVGVEIPKVISKDLNIMQLQNIFIFCKVSSCQLWRASCKTLLY